MRNLRGETYNSLILKAKHLQQNRILIGIPMTGLIRSEWAIARWAQIIPCNWSASDCIQWMNQTSPLGYSVADARNLIVDQCVKHDFQWLLFIDHDVVLPPHTFVAINEYMMDAKIPVVSGLYYAKAHPPQPLIYRGRGNGYYRNWKLGQKIWVDGIPMGCTLIHGSILKEMSKDAPEYKVHGETRVKRVFDTPAGVYRDPETNETKAFAGTEDLAWCNRVIAGKYLQKSGWKKIGEQKHPFLIDTTIFCRHITNDGQVYPLGVG